MLPTFSARNQIFSLSALLCILTFIVFSPSLKNGFTNWDDPQYVTENIAVKNFSIKEIFTTHVNTNYHPLTMLSFAVEYRFFKLKPFVYHFNNILLHTINVLLVFALIHLISKNIPLAFVTALLFAVHPFRVESVAWITERKDVLTGAFYLGALYCYSLYIQSSLNKKFLGFTFLFFLLACLSKPQSIALTLTLFVFDFYFQRPLSKRLVLEKIPFALGSLALLWVEYLGIKSWLVLPRDMEEYSLIEKVFLTSCSLTGYLVKSFIPYKLSALYPYPEKTNGMFSAAVYVSMIVPCILIYLVIRLRHKWRAISFGILFFLANIALALAIIWTQGSPMNDRFTYIPSIGIAFLTSFVLVHIVRQMRSWQKYSVTIVLTVYIGTLSVLSFERCSVWKNGFSLFSDVIKHYPQIGLAYSKCGVILSEANLHEEALKYFDKAIQIKPNTYEFRNNRGLAYFRARRYKEAVEELTIAMRLNRLKPSSYANRGEAYTFLNEYDLAMADFDKAIELSPKEAWVYFKKANALDFFNKSDLAIQYYTRTLTLDPFYIYAYNNRGILYKQKGLYDLALKDYTRAIELNPGLAEAYTNRANLYRIQGDLTKALEDQNKAAQLKQQSATISKTN